MAASAKTLWASLGGMAAICWVGGFLACATGSPGPSATAETTTLSDVRVEREGEGVVVELPGLGDAVYTAFLGHDPLRVVVDLAAVRPAETASETLAVYEGVVDEISIAEFSAIGGVPTTRVELTLSDEADYEVTPEAEGLEIRVQPRRSLVEEEEVEPGATKTAILEGEEEPQEPGPAAEAKQPPATRLLAVETEADAEGTVIRLRTDGVPSQLESFTVEDPARFVIDLPGLVHELARARVEVGSNQASRVRVGQHAEKVRVVIDAGEASAPFAERRVVPTSKGLLVALGSGSRVAAALAETEADAVVLPAAVAEAGEEPSEAASETETSDSFAEASAEAPTDTEPGAEAAPVDESAAGEQAPAETAPDAIRVYGVQYDAQESRDRVAILSEKPIEYQLLRPDEETLVVSIPGATIAPEATVRVAPESEGPVSLVTAFQQPDMAEPEVRVVVKRAPGLLPRVTRQGTMLWLDFARGGAHAKTPPVLTPGAEQTLADGAEAMDEPAADEPAPSTASGKAVASAAASIAPTEPPAAIEPEQSIDILEEGGLLDGKEYVGRRISLDFKDVDIQDVLRLIADVSDLNLIAGDEVEGRVTIRLVDVPWDQALDVILLTKGLGFVRVGNVLRIAPAEVLKAEEEARLQERRAKERLEDLLVKLQPVNYADVTEVSNMVKRLLTPRGSVDVDKRTNTVIIKDIASVIDEATALIKAIDTQTPQVLIEAKVVEANLDFSRELGSQWGVGSNPDEDEVDFEINSTEPITVQDTGFPFEQANNIVVKNPISSTATGLLNLGAFILDDRFNVDIRLEAAETEGEGKVISSPRVVTLDNREAIIQQGVSIPFQTFENGDAQLEFIDAVLMLKVTPHITADRSIIMDIEVSRNAPDDSVPTPTGSPAIAKNQAQTETLVKDGQTLVLGGIYVVQKADNGSRVPYVHSIPIFGKLFQNKTIRDIRKELLIFVTPRIVQTPELSS